MPRTNHASLLLILALKTVQNCTLEKKNPYQNDENFSEE